MQPGLPAIRAGGVNPCDDPWGEAKPKRMSKEQPMKTVGTRRRAGARGKSPEWASGLRRLYDSVVEEPLPDSFSKLLDQLDDDAHG